MIRQYGAQRFLGGSNPRRIGVIPVGAVFYLQDDWWWRDRFRGKPICREPWIVTAFFNGTMGASRRNRDTGHWESTYISGRSDMALVRSLRDGRLQRVAVRTLILHDDEGLAMDDRSTIRRKPGRVSLRAYIHSVMAPSRVEQSACSTPTTAPRSCLAT